LGFQRRLIFGRQTSSPMDETGRSFTFSFQERLATRLFIFEFKEHTTSQMRLRRERSVRC
jgi:hypothetical protein